MNSVTRINASDLKYMVHKAVNEVISRQKVRLNENDDEKSYTAIGFASKFYTLWHIIERVERTPYGVYERTLYQFVKSISTDLEKAKAKYPDAVFIPDLRGHHSFERTKRMETYGEDEFRKGKYAGQKVADCKDLGYLCWALQDCPSVFPDAAKPVAEDILTAAGYRIIHEDWGTKIIFPEEIEAFEKAQEECDEVLAQIENGAVTVYPMGNLDGEGILYDGSKGQIRYQFPEDKYKSMYYRGYYYGLPMDAKGTGKKIKGKELIIIPEDYELDDKTCYYFPILNVKVKDFKIN